MGEGNEAEAKEAARRAAAKRLYGGVRMLYSATCELDGSTVSPELERLIAEQVDVLLREAGAAWSAYQSLRGAR